MYKQDIMVGTAESKANHYGIVDTKLFDGISFGTGHSPQYGGTRV